MNCGGRRTYELALVLKRRALHQAGQKRHPRIRPVAKRHMNKKANRGEEHQQS